MRQSRLPVKLGWATGAYGVGFSDSSSASRPNNPRSFKKTCGDCDLEVSLTGLHNRPSSGTSMY